ncbi:MAG: hypothetical protein ABJE95_15080 [Byssovorax sp.]
MRKSILLGPVVVMLAACGETSGSTSSTGGTGGGGGGASCPNDLPASCPVPAPKWGADVAPVIEARCAVCHAMGGVAADKPLTTYAEVFSRRGAILNQVHACKMPQAGSTQLTAAERAALQGWLVCGAPDD